MSHIDWVRKIYRIFRANDPTDATMLLIKTHDYKWFNCYRLDEKTFEFTHVEEIELYVNKAMFAEGRFHTVNKAQ